VKASKTPRMTRAAIICPDVRAKPQEHSYPPGDQAHDRRETGTPFPHDWSPEKMADSIRKEKTRHEHTGYGRPPDEAKVLKERSVGHHYGNGQFVYLPDEGDNRQRKRDEPPP